MRVSQVKTSWKRIDAFLKKQMPKEWLDFPGLGESDILFAEEVFGHRLPDDVRESYKNRNGLPSVEIVPKYYGNIGYFVPLIQVGDRWGPSSSDALGTWRFLKEIHDDGDFEPEPWTNPRGAIRKVKWLADWIPLFDDSQGDYVFLDMNPPKRGIRGQMIEWLRMDGPTKVLSRSFGNWLRRLAEEIEKGHFILQTDHHNRMATLIRRSHQARREREERIHENDGG